MHSIYPGFLSKMRVIPEGYNVRLECTQSDAFALEFATALVIDWRGGSPFVRMGHRTARLRLQEHWKIAQQQKSMRCFNINLRFTIQLA